ncbi:Beta-glucosidase [Fusarium keratoplasticum]|uniref:Beta-glucosidase n=1 Tax=Fusarium keratoplasticum TaxID=1328300 RepID=A0ACC0R8D9_9HYPO|nr:Beta-glucosidase [Fusarium keratoplasticum]KAI8675710.1 Beta-glucosidase [Fusarium keratoplasticum]
MESTVDIEAILTSLTLEEKVTLLSGRALFESAPIPDKGVPFIKFTDGPNGTRGPAADGNTAAACFPAACSIAATFDLGIARRVGHALGQEAVGKGARCLLAPTVCIHRHPLGGRNFESFSEDPFLSGKLASQTIQGVQNHGIAATIKHFVANEQETERFTVNEAITERALREIYLRPFEIAIKEASPWAVMTAYNCINGVHCDANKWLLEDVLRGQWKWKGLVMSDWGGTNTVAEGLKAGLGLEMPGPPQVRKLDAVMEALKQGELTKSHIDDRSRTVLQFLARVGAFNDTEVTASNVIPVAVDRPEHRALIRDAGARGIVLLKNSNHVLPINKENTKGKKIALIGYAKVGLAHGGGSAAVNAHYKITPWDALHTALGEHVEFAFAMGAHRERLLAPITKDAGYGEIIGLDGQPGFTRQLSEFRGPLVSTIHGFPASVYSPLGSQESLWKDLDLIGYFTPKETGTHYLACSGVGPTQVFIDDRLVLDQPMNYSDPMGAFFGVANESEIRVHLEANKKYRLCIHSSPPVDVGLEILEGRTGVRMGFSLESEHDADLVTEAAQVAAEADIAIVFTGHDPQWESEGRDQEGFHLPRNQDAMVAAVAAANHRTIVVNSTGVPVAMPWVDKVAAVLQAWFPGQECGNAIADVLTGAVNPEGRLPVSFPRKIQDAPAHGNFPGTYVNGRLEVDYAEGVFVGYRHYDRVGHDKLNFAFGHGLSYTDFAYGNLKVSQEADNAFAVAVDVSNSGSLEGATVAQIYVGKKNRNADQHPVKALVAFQKVFLKPGEEQTLQLSVAMRDLAYYDEALGRWVVQAGEYDFLLASSASDILEVVPVTVEGSSYSP